jgi:hypothetical protein
VISLRSTRATETLRITEPRHRLTTSNWYLLVVVLFGVGISACGGGRDGTAQRPSVSAIGRPVGVAGAPHAATRADRLLGRPVSKTSARKARMARTRLGAQLAEALSLERSRLTRGGIGHGVRQSVLRGIADHLRSARKLAARDTALRPLLPELAAAGARFRALARADGRSRKALQTLAVAGSALTALAQHAAGLGVRIQTVL